MQYLPETFGKRLCRFPNHLSAEYVPHRVLHHFRLLFTIVPVELGEILKSQADRHLVGTRRCNQVVESPEINGGQLVYDDRTFELSFLVDQLHDAGVVEAECRRIDVLPVGIVAHTQDFRLLRIVDVQREIIACHHPIKLWGNHACKGDFCGSDLALELVLSS